MAMKIKPQPGPQETFLSTPADVALYGGAAGGGKSFALLLEALRHINHLGYSAVIFRRTSVQVRNAGSLWDTSESLYPFAGGHPSESTLEWNFPAGTRVKFAHMEHEKNKLDWQGSQIVLIGFDELTHFTESQFFYMLSRNRSTCGIRPYIRATTNPDADSWVAEFIDWYIGEDGYPIRERSGVIRWFIRIDGTMIWGDSKEELMEKYPGTLPKSFTFISAKLEDNQILMQKDPSYKANLEALPFVERERLLGGNWKVKPAAGLYFKREWFEDKFIDAAPKCSRYVRFWDCAATEAKNTNNPDYSVGVLAGELTGKYYVLDVQRFRKSPGAADEHMKQTAYSDGRDVMVREEEEPGSSGKRVIATHATTIFKGFNFLGVKSTGSKVVRAGPVSAACQNGNVYIVHGSWNNEFLSELEGFPERAHDDQVDALSGAFNSLFHKPAKVPTFSPGFGLSGGLRI
ncbi:phage terminase large subunit [Methanolobus psychrotolerans]|uniref:phage terminase large subunit n=1 Tax=Methanolobus psychrotolerans TaxID=1874706 RepID=UPI000B91B42F|nr:phage terminase large subunit [Methanolobus psychrotolerans]